MRKKRNAKPVKTKKTNAKKTSAKKSNQSIAMKMEKDFRAMPAKIAKQFKTEAAAMKKIEAKFNSQVKKAISLQKSIVAKLTKLNAKPQSKTTLKQIKAAQKAEVMTTKSLQEVQIKLDQIQKNVYSLSLQQNKYQAINKALVNLDKEYKQKLEANQQRKQAVKVTKPRNTQTATTEQPSLTESQMSEVELMTETV